MAVNLNGLDFSGDHAGGYIEPTVYEAGEEHESIDASSMEKVNESDDWDDIEGAPYSRREPGKPSRDISSFPDNVTFGTDDVAKMLNISSQTARNYADEFEDYLEITKGLNGQRRFTKENVDKLRKILEIKDKNKLTIRQTKEYLGGGGAQEIMPESRRVEMLLNGLQENLSDALKSVLSEVLQRDQMLLEDQQNKSSALIQEIKESNERATQELSNKIAKQEEYIDSLKAIIEEKSRDNDEIHKKLEQISAATEEKNNEITELKELANRQLEEMSKIQEQTRKKRFGIFK